MGILVRDEEALVGIFVTALVVLDEGRAVGMRVVVVEVGRETEVDFEELGGSRSRGARSVPVLGLLSLVVRELLPLFWVGARRSAMMLDLFWKFGMLSMEGSLENEGRLMDPSLNTLPR